MIGGLVGWRRLAWLHGEHWHLELRHPWHACHWGHLSGSLAGWLSLTSHLLLQQSRVLHLLVIHANVLLLHVDELLLEKLLLLGSHLLAWSAWRSHHHVWIQSLRELHAHHLRIHEWHLGLSIFGLSIFLWLSFFRRLLLFVLLLSFLFLLTLGSTLLGFLLLIFLL